MYACSTKLVVNSPSATCAAAAIAASTSPFTTRPRTRTLSGFGAWIGWRVFASASSISVCAVSTVQRIGISSSPIASTACCSPTRHSTASPRKRTRPSASTGWSFTSGKMPKLFTGTSRAVTTSTSPGCAARNGPKSPSVKRALACGERMVRSQSAPAGAASAA